MAAPQEPRVRFDNTINLGHILTCVGFIASAAVAWSTMDKRVVVLEEARVYQAVIDKRQDDDRATLKVQVREDYRDISNKLDRVLDRTIFNTQSKGK